MSVEAGAVDFTLSRACRFARSFMVGLAVALLLLGCSGGGSDDDDTFVCTITGGSTSEVHMEVLASGGRRCGLLVQLGNLGYSDAYGVAFRLSYPGQLVLFDGATETGGSG